MRIKDFLRLLGQEIQAPDEETFDLFAQELPSSQNLGFIDSKAKTLDLTIAGRDLTIHQSPGILSSSRAGGTTGAVVWKITPLFAEWISSATNPLFAQGILTSGSSVIELGCGIAGIVGLLLAPRVSSFLLTDQIYVAKLLEENINENVPTTGTVTVTKSRPATKSAKSITGSSDSGTGTGGGQIRFATLDWEEDEATPSLLSSSTSLFPSSPATNLPPSRKGNTFDLILACDCIYNEALVKPFISTCADLCRLKSSSPGHEHSDDEDDSDEERNPAIVIIAQQLRDPSVFETFITTFAEDFHVWRVPDEMLRLERGLKKEDGQGHGRAKGKVKGKGKGEGQEQEQGKEGGRGLGSNTGFVVHLGILKGTIGAEVLEELSSTWG
ncbi:ribosomal lysine N-methyltransferase 5 [Naviculisporaceae sp. PSN 640]